MMRATTRQIVGSVNPNRRCLMNGECWRVHQLKIWPEPFRDIASGAKSYEVRTADREYLVGDRLHLRQFFPDPERVSGLNALFGTGDEGRYGPLVIVVEVVHITRGGPPSPLPGEVVVLGIEELGIYRIVGPGWS